MRISVYPRSEILLKAIPEAKSLNGQWIAVPQSLRNAQVLRHYQYPIPPIVTRSTYDFPAPPGITPYESQIITTNFLVTHPRCFLLSDMGVGKTNAMLWASDWLMRQHPPGTFRCLILAPLSILHTVWANAIAVPTQKASAASPMRSQQRLRMR